MNLLSILFPQTIYKTSSKFNNDIRVIDHVFDRRLVVGGLTQSGGILKQIWEKALHELKIKNNELKIKNVLILGFGGGTAAKIINKKWPSARIVGVEIDPVMISVGKKYFAVHEIKNLEIIVEDAVKFLHKKNNTSFDIIIVDLYKGFFIEKNIQNEQFLQKIAQKMSKKGIVIFNVIKRQNDDFEASDFLDKLSRIFQDYFCKRIITNDIFFCKKTQ